ncbi:MAG: amidase [Candidatus Dormibacteraceae bacterium]
MSEPGGDDLELDRVTLAELWRRFESGRLEAAGLTAACLERVEALDRSGPTLRALIEVNPDAARIAKDLDVERRSHGPRGPLHGVPILVKDNIDTADQMATSAGSLALAESRPSRDATVVERLREAGAVLLGKANLSEWANFRSTRSSSGWSGRGGQCRNPHVLDRSPGGSSSGSAAAVAAGLAPAALGTETDGSIMCPSAACGVVGIKPTVGLTSRAGVIPIAASQDTVGVHARTVADAAALLSVIAGPDPRDPATAAAGDRGRADYTRFLEPGSLRGARIGVARATVTGYSEHADRVFEAALSVLAGEGVVLIDPADIPSSERIRESEAELVVLRHEFHAGIDAYLAERGDVSVRSLAELVAFNEANADRELACFGQEHFLESLATGSLSADVYLKAREECRRLGRAEGIDAVLAAHRLDAVVAPTGGPAWSIDPLNGDRYLGASCEPAALAGYPLVTVPAGVAWRRLPIGITFMGPAFSEPKLIALAFAFEQATAARPTPGFLPTLPFD